MRDARTETAESLLARTEFLVEAGSFERLALWGEWHDTDRPRRDGRRVPWEQVPCGWSVTVGTVGRARPVCISLSWARIAGRLVCFFEPTSRAVCWDLIDAFLKPFTRTHDGGRESRCDAMNFHHCLRAIGAL